MVQADHPIAQRLNQLSSSIQQRLQDTATDPTNRDVLWSVYAMTEVMAAHFAFALATRAITDALKPEKEEALGRRFRRKVEDLAITAVAGLAVAAVIWVVMMVMQSGGVSLPMP